MQKKLLPIALLALSQVAFAQQPPPGAGGQLLQIPPSPVAPRAAPEFRIEQRAAPAAPAAAADQVKVTVNSLRVAGASAFSESDLIALTGFTPGRELTLSELEGMAARITAHYRASGYFVAQAYLPAQDIKDNAVTIAVSEGRYGDITLRNTSNLSDGLARRQMDGLSSGDAITAEPLESRLLLLSDIPGVRRHIDPGAGGIAPDTSDLIVDVAPGRRVTGSIDADNAGNPYTGEYRIGGTIEINNPLGLGDQATLRALTSGAGLKYARASYQLQAGRGQVGVAYSWLDYSLGKQFESLHAHGTAEVASIYGRYPLIRSRDNNLYAQLAYDAKTFEDKVDATGSVINRKSGVLMGGVYGDHRDQLGGGGLTSYGLILSAGKLDIQTPAALAAGRAHGAHQRKLQQAVVQRGPAAEPGRAVLDLRGDQRAVGLEEPRRVRGDGTGRHERGAGLSRGRSLCRPGLRGDAGRADAAAEVLVAAGPHGADRICRYRHGDLSQEAVVRTVRTAARSAGPASA